MTTTKRCGIGCMLMLVLLARTGLSQKPAAQPLPQPPPAEELLQQADSALKKEDYAAASAALQGYLAQKPEDYRAKFNLALAYSMTGRQGDAIRLYQEVLVQQPDLLAARVNLGILLLQQGNAAEALDQFQQVVAQKPDHWAAQVNRAGALVELGRNQEAAEAYQRALALKPDHAPTQLAYGKVLAATDPVAAETHLRRALELDPSLEEAKSVLAGVLVAQAAQGADTLTEAEGLYREMLASHPADTKLHLRLADIYLQQKRLPEAIQELETARAGTPANADLNRTLLEAYLEAKENDKAQALLPDVLAQDPADARLYMLQGSLLMAKRQYPEAADAFRSAIKLAPREAQGYTDLASALYLMSDYEGTVMALENVAALGKDTPGTYFLRGITLDKLQIKERAYDNYQKFLQSDGKKNPDQEFQARQRSRVLERELKDSRRH